MTKPGRDVVPNNHLRKCSFGDFLAEVFQKLIQHHKSLNFVQNSSWKKGLRNSV